MYLFFLLINHKEQAVHSPGKKSTEQCYKLHCIFVVHLKGKQKDQSGNLMYILGTYVCNMYMWLYVEYY
jgi:hypothetical protein